MSPPGTANCNRLFSACNDIIRLKMGLHLFLPALSFVTMPGLISTSIPSRRTPVRMDPPATPPFSSSTSAPGLLTSKERMTMRRGEEAKSRIGIGIRFTMYSLTASILYFNCADIGTMGDDSATVPVIDNIRHFCSEKKLKAETHL